MSRWRPSGDARRRSSASAERFFVPSRGLVLALVIAILLSGATVAQPPPSAGARVLYLLIAAIATKVLLSHVRAAADVLLIYNPIRTYRIAWADVGSIRMEQTRLVRVATVQTKVGRRIRAWGLVRAKRSEEKDVASRYVMRLDALLRERGSRPETEADLR